MGAVLLINDEIDEGRRREIVGAILGLRQYEISSLRGFIIPIPGCILDEHAYRSGSFSLAVQPYQAS